MAYYVDLELICDVLQQLAIEHWWRFEQSWEWEELDKSIFYDRITLGLYPEGHSERLEILNDFGNHLNMRFKQYGRPEDLEESIQCDRAVLRLTPEGHPGRPGSLNNLSVSLQNRFQRYGRTTDLDEAIKCSRAALQLCPDGHPDRSMYLNTLGAALRARFQQFGETADLEEAIKRDSAALQLCSDDHPSFTSLNNLAVSLRARFSLHGKIPVLDEAIKYHRAALQLPPGRHPNHSLSLNNLANSLVTRFQQCGQIADLDEAIEHHRAALQLRPDGNPNRCGSLDNLANCLQIRYQQHGWITDLGESIEHRHPALRLRPAGHPDRSASLINLAASIQSRFHHYGQEADLEEAIAHARAALQLCSDNHPYRPMSLNGLAGSLRHRFERHGQTADLDESIEHHRAALQLCSDGHPYRSVSLDNLAASLRTRFDHYGQVTDINEAIKHHRTALQLCPEGHPDHSGSLSSFASSLLSRFMEFGLTQDFEECTQLLELAAEHKFSSLMMRLEIAYRWARLARSHAHPTTSRAYRVAMLLFQRAVIISPTLHSQHDFLLEKCDHGQLALDAAAYAIEENRFEEAIEILEQGRALLWSLMRGFRAPLERLAETNKQLADKFRNRVLFEERLKLKRRISNEQEGLISEIRRILGFEDFLTATPLKVLQQAASEGPVIVVNHCEYRSDALIVLSREDLSIVCIPLDEEFYDDSTDLCEELLETRTSFGANSQEYDRILCQTMKTLWDRVVSKVVDKLKELGIEEGARIWWCPTSILSALPFHAAGPFRDSCGTTSYLLDKYISSYTPTLGALINAQSGGSGDDRVVREPVVLIVGDTSLESASKEICNIRSYRGIRTKVRCNASRDIVIKALRKTSWVHFVCHGRLNSKPFDSAFKLSDRGLTLLDIVQTNLPNAEFAFLSACHTAEQPHDGMHDEVLHLAAAMQFSGFRSVIGSMWELLDVDGPFFAKVVYGHMCSCKESEATYKRAAAGLRKAAVKLKLEGRNEIRTERWVNLIHIGA
ncbi:TPR-like protein [Fomitiporia mediterranea MF3/22]|uniref:TPR-like protein n=1 Tax=Fomitiporia mediterranea (strain MF3/22) TaxID=694068 RepID=UPI000440971A|nr:TPR-like protein [Fomitiporia mediterranea MF3/22]EJC99024.1 TPR-like protein [Fomitiporia mediterranea MF3/22]